MYRYNGPTYTTRTNAHDAGDYPFRYINNEGQIVQHILPFEANIPLDRSSVFGRATYDLSDSVSAYAQFLNVSSKTRRYFTDSPAVAGWGNIALHGNGVYAPSLNADGSTNAAYRPGGQYGLNCAPTGGCTKSQAFPVSPELAAVLDSRPDPEATWSFNYGMDFGDFGAPGNLYRSVFSETRTNQGAFGLKGKLDGIDGTWDVVVSKGTAKLDLHLEGYASLTRVRTLLASPNFGKGFFAQGNSGSSRLRLLGRHRTVHQRRARLRRSRRYQPGLSQRDVRHFEPPVPDGAEIRRGQRARPRLQHARG